MMILTTWGSQCIVLAVKIGKHLIMGDIQSLPDPVLELYMTLHHSQVILQE